MAFSPLHHKNRKIIEFVTIVTDSFCVCGIISITIQIIMQNIEVRCKAVWSGSAPYVPLPATIERERA